jgi:hypothetical protein
MFQRENEDPLEKMLYPMEGESRELLPIIIGCPISIHRLFDVLC